MRFPSHRKHEYMGIGTHRILQLLDKDYCGYYITRRPSCFVLEHSCNLVAIVTPQQYIWLRRNRMIELMPGEELRGPGKYKAWIISDKATRVV